MEQVKQISSEITCMKNDLNDHTNDIIYLKDDTVRHVHAIKSLKIDVANCSDLLQETADDSTFHAKTFKTIRQGQAQVQEDIHNLHTIVATHEVTISPNGDFYLQSLWVPYDVETWPLVKTSKERNFHWSKYHNNLKKSKLQGDDLLYLKYFYPRNELNNDNDDIISLKNNDIAHDNNIVPLDSTTSSKVLLLPSTAHTKSSVIYLTIIPDEYFQTSYYRANVKQKIILQQDTTSTKEAYCTTIHHKWNGTSSCHKIQIAQRKRIRLIHNTHRNIISCIVAPTLFKTLKRNFDDDRFNVLHKFIVICCPRLGGDKPDLYKIQEPQCSPPPYKRYAPPSMILANVASTERESDDNDLLISVIPVRLFLPSSKLVDLISYFTLSCANLHTGVSMLSTPKDACPSFANVRRLAFIRDSRKRINSETLILFRLKCSLVLNNLRRIDVQLGTPQPFFVIRGMSTRNGKFIPTEVVPFWLDSDQPLLCGSCHCDRIFFRTFLLLCPVFGNG